MVLLDTDKLTLFLRGEPIVVERVRNSTDVVAITIVSKAEMLRGRIEGLLKADSLEATLKAQDRLKRAEMDLAKFKVVEISEGSHTVFEQLRRSKPTRTMGRADLLIASLTLSNNAVLATRNVRDFRRVPGLKIENWLP